MSPFLKGWVIGGCVGCFCDAMGKFCKHLGVLVTVTKGRGYVMRGIYNDVRG